jgi:hypothetical protein
MCNLDDNSSVPPYDFTGDEWQGKKILHTEYVLITILPWKINISSNAFPEYFQYRRLDAPKFHTIEVEKQGVSVTVILRPQQNVELDSFSVMAALCDLRHRLEQAEHTIEQTEHTISELGSQVSDLSEGFDELSNNLGFKVR